MSRNEQRDKLNAWEAERKRQAQAAFPLAEEELEALFDVLDASLSSRECDHSRRLTEAWLVQRGHSIDSVVPWLEANGGYCDCEVLANVEQHFQENRNAT